MANRWMNQFRLTFEKKVVDVFAHVTFGSTGAPTLDTAQSKGIVSVTRNSAGNFTFVFGTQSGMLDVYNKLLGAKFTFDSSGNSHTAPAAPLMDIYTNAVATAGTAALTVQFRNTSGIATDPASGEGVYMNFTFKDSTAP